ncbi:hypothetical protein FRC17_004678, partial [Serendipita sp. 399]
HDRLKQAIQSHKSKIKDDWDDDDEEDDAENAPSRLNNYDSQSERESEKTLSRLASHFPQSKPTATSTNLANGGSSFPPELSLEPQVRILKRPKASQVSHQSSSPTQSERQTLQEREDKYRLARERIFGASSSPSDVSLNSTTSSLSSPRTTIASSEIPPEATDPALHPNKRNTNKEQRDGEVKAVLRPMREPLGPGTRPAFSRNAEPSRRVAPQEGAKDGGAVQNA